VAKDKVARGEPLDPATADPDRLRRLEAENTELRMEQSSSDPWSSGSKRRRMTVASFIASQRADHGVVHVISCRALCVRVVVLQVA
jgi:hypothetical protein